MSRALEQLYEASIKQLDPQLLRDWVLENADVCIVDVRDSDYRYAHITGSVHYPSRQFSNEAIAKLLQQYPLFPDQVYVFHCMRSQVRGPKCCKRFVRYLCLNTEVGDDFTQLPKIYILKGGLRQWNNLYGDDPRLIKPIEE